MAFGGQLRSMLPDYAEGLACRSNALPAATLTITKGITMKLDVRDKVAITCMGIVILIAFKWSSDEDIRGCIKSLISDMWKNTEE